MNEVNTSAEKSNISVKEKKILAKIEKEQKKLDVLIAKRTEIEKKYQTEFDKIDAEIKEQEKIVDNYREQEKQAKLAKLSSIIGKKGVDIDTLLNAVANNDLYSVQEMLEKAGKEKALQSEHSPATSETATIEPAVSTSTSSETNNNTSE